jgi:hypothetical protein
MFEETYIFDGALRALIQVVNAQVPQCCMKDMSVNNETRSD